MTTSISERANAYRVALRLALNDGRSVKDATDLAKRAARGGADIPQQKPVVLTDAELRLIDENELTADECDRLLELEQLEDIAEMEAFNATLPKASLHGSITAVKSSVVKELAEALGYRIIEVPLVPEVPSDEELDIMQAVREHEALEAKFGTYMVPNENIAEELFRRRMAKEEGNCEPEDYMTDALGQYEPGGLVAQAMSDAAKEQDDPNCDCGCEDAYGPDVSTTEMIDRDLELYGNEPVDMGDFGAGTLADAWRDGVGIKTPAGLRIKAKAAFMAELDEALNPGCTDPELDGAAEWAEEERRHQAEREEECPTTRRVRDCDIPATLRAIELPATEDHNAYRLWFDGDDEMQQFLAGRCLYADADRAIKDRDGKVVGMWFYAHFGPTPVS